MSAPQFLLFGITPPVFTPEQQIHLNDLFQEGLDYLYIRNQAAQAADWFALLEKIEPEFYSRLLLPANAPAAAAGGKYIRHIREQEREGRPPAGQENKQGLFSTSVHSLATVPHLKPYHFVFYSPLFPSISKPGYQPQQDLQSVARQLTNLQSGPAGLPRVIGLGGIHAANVAQVQAAGFQGAALLGALWESASPVTALTRVKQAIG